MFRPLICALQFLTILPIHGNYVRNDKDLARSMVFYPLVGLLIGTISAGCYLICINFFTPALSLVIAYIAGIALTGGLHIDGFADMCDGFYAGKDKSEILNIMKDPHIGTMAVIGIFCLLLLKFSLLFSLLFQQKLINSFLIVPAISRWIMTMAACTYPYARADGTAKPFVENAEALEAVLSSLLLFVIVYSVTGISGIIVAIGALGIAFIFLQWVKSKIGGITGDILGGINEISEVSVLFFMQFSIHTIEKGWLYKCMAGM